ncbi:MAG: hypothetical protein WAM28_02155 [Chlamydiales bacterium]
MKKIKINYLKACLAGFVITGLIVVICTVFGLISFKFLGPSQPKEEIAETNSAGTEEKSL